MRRSGVRWLAGLVDRDTAMFLDRFETILEAYRSGAMRYGCFIAHKPHRNQIRNQPAHELLTKGVRHEHISQASRMVSFKGEAESHPSLFATSETLNLLRFSRRYSCVQCLCEMVLEIFHDPIVIEQGIVDVVQRESGDAAYPPASSGMGYASSRRL